MDKFLRTISRILLAGLLIFELLNEFEILNFTLNFTWLGLALTSIIAWSIIETASYFLKKYCGHPIAGLAAIVAVAAIYLDAFGDILGFYGKYSWYDQAAHLLGSAAAGGLLLFIIYSFTQCGKIKLGFMVQGLFALSATALLGVTYELEEYLEDYFTGSHRLGDGPDTANDLLLDVAGALLAILISIIYLKLVKKKTVNT
ncbi:hypothetical protein KJ853_01140 [Patescibacteria group bacterium]|nr:hypothetical protein [Patescibacteria group bacterium]